MELHPHLLGYALVYSALIFPASSQTPAIPASQTPNSASQTADEVFEEYFPDVNIQEARKFRGDNPFCCTIHLP